MKAAAEASRKFGSTKARAKSVYRLVERRMERIKQGG
jgi:hypothetical protein